VYTYHHLNESTFIKFYLPNVLIVFFDKLRKKVSSYNFRFAS